MAKEKIVIITGSLERGGCEIHLSRVLPKLKRQGFDIEVFIIGKKGSLAEEFTKKGIKINGGNFWLKNKILHKIFQIPSLILTAIELYIYLLFRKPQIAHFFLPLPYIIGAPITILARIPYKIMSRRSLNNYQKTLPKVLVNLEKNLHTHMQAILGNSKRVVHQLIDEENTSPAQTKLIYNGIDILPLPTQEQKQQIREQKDIPKSCLVLSCVANLIQYKGHYDLLNAIAIIKPQLDKVTNNNWRLLLIGRDNGIAQDLKKHIQIANLEKNITFLGQQNDVLKLWSITDIGLLCSHQEGFSNAILEAMSMTVPMIATNVGGNQEAITNQETGLIIPPRQPNKIGGAILKLAKEPRLRNCIGDKARNHIIENFNSKRCISEYSGFYEKAIKTLKSKKEIEEHNHNYELKVKGLK